MTLPSPQFKVSLFLALALFSSLYITRVHGIPGTSDGLPTPGVDSPSNIWAPYGPYVNRLQLKFYTDEVSMFSAFKLGHFDLSDWNSFFSDYALFDTSPNFIQSVTQGQFNMFEFDFNNYAGPGDNRWANAWNCNFDHGNSLCGIAIRQGFAHLFDRVTWARVGPCGGTCQAIADPTPPSKTPAGSSLANQQSWELLDGTHETIDGRFPNIKASEDFAFHIAETCSNGFCSSIATGPLNFCAAADEILLASKIIQDAGGTPIATGKNTNCVLTGVNPAITAWSGHMRAFTRPNDPRRFDMGRRLANAMDALFGATVVDPTYGAISVVGAVVFVTQPEDASDDWEWATTGWSLGGPYPDHLSELYSSAAASNYPPYDVCDATRPADGEPLNYGDVCIPAFDSATLSAAQTTDPNVFKAQTTLALNIFGSHAATIPAYSRGARYTALRDMAGLVNSRGLGYSNFYTLLNGQKAGVMGIDPSFVFGGGDPSTLRWGQNSGTSYLNPLLARTPWELNVIGEVYDTLFQANPVAPGQVFCWMCSTYSTVIDSAGNTHFLVQLKQNLEFHDGVPVTAYDVAFSILAMRDASSIPCWCADPFSPPQPPLGVSVYSNNALDIVMRSQSINHLHILSTIPIIPQHIMGSGDNFYAFQTGIYGSAPGSECRQLNGAFCSAAGVGTVITAKRQTSYDPIAANEFIGSGPFACISQGYASGPPVGTIGGGCVRTAANTNGGQAIAGGSTMLLTKFDFSTAGNPFNQYHRTFNPAWGSGSQSGQYQEWSWADANNDGVVDALDLGQVSLCTSGVNANCSASQLAYWQSLYPSVTQDAAVVASHLDDSWVAPFSWSTTSLENIVQFTA